MDDDNVPPPRVEEIKIGPLKEVERITRKGAYEVQRGRAPPMSEKHRVKGDMHTIH